jgi:predicted nucleic acid-binding protein
MPRYVIADASVFILFDKIDRLDILKGVYQKVITTPEIANEFKKPLPEWITLETAKDKKYQTFLQTQIDSGEASAIALAIEKDESLLILDDLKARKLAKRLGLKFTGTLGVINRAKELGYIDKIKPIVDKLKGTDFRIADIILENLLRRNKE